jgi:hypothetical protein
VTVIVERFVQQNQRHAREGGHPIRFFCRTEIIANDYKMQEMKITAGAMIFPPPQARGKFGRSCSIFSDDVHYPIISI